MSVKWKNLSNETKEKLISYYETKYRGKYFEEDTLLSDMNDSLREEISCHNTRKLIEKVPFLKREEGDGRDEIFFNKMATILHARYYITGDFITKQGDSGNDMYFILSGKVNVFVNGTKVVSLYDGAYIG
ncbi:UNVERIFIED_CONTAM: Potassium/sodium hyperpolarization-activated cyclic nucleotide-gated channel 4, partial [Siphonaria sp. JEL0065]